MHKSIEPAPGASLLPAPLQLELPQAQPHAPASQTAHSHVPAHYPRRTGRRALVIGAALVVGLVAIFVLRYFSNAREEAPLEADVLKSANELVTVDVIHVKSGSMEETLTLPGEARPFRESTVFARTSGYVSKWTVDDDDNEIEWTFDIGDSVKEGQVIATIETPELNNQIAAAEAKVNQLKAQVKVVETSTVFARLSFDRWQASSGDGAVSVQERDQKKSELDTNLAKLDAARAEVALAQADLDRLQTMNTFKEVTAPFDGTITDRRVDVGDLVSAGSTSNTTCMFTIAQSDQMRVWVDVPQAMASRIVRGIAAVASYGGREFSGRVDRTAETINLASRTLKVEVLVPNPKHELLPGTYLQVKFQFNRAHPPLQIPSSALAWRTTGPQAAVVDGNGRIRFVAVKIMRDTGDLVEVEGLTVNERVALNIGSQAQDGGRVTAHEVDSPQLPDAPAHAKDSVTSPTSDTGRKLALSH